MFESLCVPFIWDFFIPSSYNELFITKKWPVPLALYMQKTQLSSCTNSTALRYFSNATRRQVLSELGLVANQFSVTRRQVDLVLSGLGVITLVSPNFQNGSQQECMPARRIRLRTSTKCFCQSILDFCTTNTLRPRETYGATVPSRTICRLKKPSGAVDFSRFTQLGCPVKTRAISGVLRSMCLTQCASF